MYAIFRQIERIANFSILSIVGNSFFLLDVFYIRVYRLKQFSLVDIFMVIVSLCFVGFDMRKMMIMTLAFQFNVANNTTEK